MVTSQNVLHAVLLLYIILDCRRSTGQVAKDCHQPLGMQDYTIPDDYVTATSLHASTTAARYGRLHNEDGAGAWCANGIIEAGSEDQYLQVQFPNASFVSRIATQGRYDHARGQEFMTSYKVNYSRDGKTWFRWKDHNGVSVLQGNSDTTTVKVQSLHPGIAGAKFIRIIPVTSRALPVCLRLELLGCRWKSGLISYSIPTPDHPPSSFHMFSDDTYDGNKSKILFSGGLGQLCDGIIGQGNIDKTMSSILTNSSGFDYVGWSTGSNKYLTMVFSFDDVRNFSKILFYCNTNQAVGASVFKSATVQATIDGLTYINVTHRATSGLMVTGFTTRVVTVSLRHIAARAFKIIIKVGKGRLLLSEVEFINEIFPPEISKRYFTQSPKTGNVGRKEPTMEPGVYPRENSIISIVMGVLLGFIFILLLLVVGLCYTQRNARKLVSPPAYTLHPTTNLTPQQVVFSSQLRVSGGTTSGTKQPIYHEITSNNSISNIYLEPIDLVGRSPPPPYKTTEQPGCSNAVHLPPSDPINSSPYAETDIFMRSFDDQPLQGVTGSSVYAVPGSVSSSRNIEKCESNSDTLPTLHGTMLKPDEEREALLQHHQNNAPHSPPEFPRSMLKKVEKLGEGQFGEVQLCLAGILLREMIADDRLPGNPSSEVLVAVKILQENASDNIKKNFFKEVRVMSRLHHPNIVRLLAVCTKDSPLAMITEYMGQGDLHQYLQNYDDVSVSINGLKTIKSQTLLQMGEQIASGMEYLSSLKFVHRDLAARNCLVGPKNEIRIGDFGMSQNTYQKDYYRIQGRAVLPIRWMAWECILMGIFSSASDVWAFGVTMWEVFSLAKLHPYHNLEDELVIENMHHFFRKTGKEIYLPRPKRCPASLFNMMRKCWKRDAQDRPSFKQLHAYLFNRLRNNSESPKPKRPVSKPPEPKFK